VGFLIKDEDLLDGNLLTKGIQKKVYGFLSDFNGFMAIVMTEYNCVFASIVNSKFENTQGK